MRHYGFAAATRRAGYERIRWLVTLAMGLVYLLHAADTITKPRRADFRCTECGGPLVFYEFIRPAPVLRPPAHDTS